MFNRILVALMLSTLVMNPVQAMVMDDDVHEAPRVAHTAKLWEGAKDVASGTKKLTYGLGSVVWDVTKLGESSVKGLASFGYGVTAPFVYFYDGSIASQKLIAKAEDYASSAWKGTKKSIGNLPTTSAYFEEGAVEFGTGIGTVAKTTYAACKDAVESETGQKVKAAVSSAASYVGSKVSSAYNWFASKVGGAVGVVGNALNYDNVSDAVNFK